MAQGSRFVDVARARGGTLGSATGETSRALYAEGMQALDTHDFAAAERACGGASRAREGDDRGGMLGARSGGHRTTHRSARRVRRGDTLPSKARRAGGIDQRTRCGEDRGRWSREAHPDGDACSVGSVETAPLQVAFDGAIVKSETARLARKVNPGHHTITVSSPGFGTATADVDVSEGEDRRVNVVLPPIVPGEAAKTPAGEAPPAPMQGAHGVPTLAIVAGGVGVAGLVVGVATALAATSKHTTLVGECSGSTCPPSAQGDLDSFHMLRTVSAVGYVMGALGIVGGAALWYFAPSRPSDKSAVVRVGPASAGVMGTF